jgi:hypothetical protein
MRIQTASLVALGDRLHNQRCCPPCDCVSYVPAGAADPTGRDSADEWGATVWMGWEADKPFWERWANDMPILAFRDARSAGSCRGICALEGNLLVWLDDATSLRGAFSELETVAGNLTIVLSPALRTLGSSFANLRTVGGTIWIDHNDGLHDLGSAFSALTTVGGGIYLESCASLRRLGGAFAKTATVAGDMSIGEMGALETLGTSFSVLTEVGNNSVGLNRSMYVGRNPSLGDLGSAFSMLASVWGGLVVWSNITLGTLGDSFSRLTRIGTEGGHGGIDIRANFALGSLGTALTSRGGVVVHGRTPYYGWSYTESAIYIAENTLSTTARFDPEKVCYTTGQIAAGGREWRLLPDPEVPEQYDYAGNPPSECS